MVSALVIARSLDFDMENIVCILIYILHRCHIKHNTEVLKWLQELHAAVSVSQVQVNGQ